MEDATYSIDCQEPDGSWYFEGTYATYALATDAVQRLLGPLQKPAVRLYRGRPDLPVSRQEVGDLRTALAAREQHLTALAPGIERLLAYWRTHRLLDEEVNDCCELVAEAWAQQRPRRREGEPL